MKFWGARGSIPTPGPGTVRYGGNTSCVEIRSGEEIIILDAGTGLRGLGNALTDEFRNQALHLTMLITHTHWDHIQGLPFFAPIYNPRCRLRLVCSEGARTGLINALTGQMESTYFPVPFSELPSNIEIEELKNFSFTLGPVSIRTLRANHPGNCVGYRLLAHDCLITFFPDTEPRPNGPDLQMIDFIRDSDALILDSQYTAAEYKRHVGWGHGCVDDSVALAIAANVKRLYLFHHDPDRDDKELDALLKHARHIAAARKSHVEVNAAHEGMIVRFPAS